MNIAFCRFNQASDLDFYIGSVSSRNTDQRVGVLHALLELGHDVTVVSYVTNKHRHVFNGESKGNFNYSWARGLKYDIHADISKFDLLLVETAAGNSMYTFKDDDSREDISYVGHFANVLRKAQGVPILIWHHGDQGLSFPFGRLSCLTDNITEEELANLSPYNYRHLFKGIDIWDGYEYTVWHQSADTQKFMDVYSVNYCRPEVHIDRAIGSVTGKCPIIDIELPIRKRSELRYDLVYVGEAKPKRVDKIRKFYDTRYATSMIVGSKWDTVDWKNKTTRYIPGRDKVHGIVQEHYNKGIACVLCLDSPLHDVSMTTTRHVQAAMSGAVLLADGSLPHVERHVGSDQYAVHTIEDVLQQLEYLEDDDYRIDSVNFQRASIPTWTDVMVPILDVGIGKSQGDDFNGSQTKNK